MAKRRNGPTRHVFVEDPDWDDVCFACKLPPGNAIHDVPRRTDEQREHEARKVGER